ncbi:MAG: hypothetical protein ACKOK8_05315, partial [Planctomycetia bacterium]
GMSPATATQATPAEDALAARIPAVLADEEATDDTPGRDPASVEPARPAAGAAATGGPTPAAGGSKLLRWAIWGAIVLAIAIFSRAKLRAGGSGPAAR